MDSADLRKSSGQRLTRRGFVRGVGAGLALSVAAPTLLAPIGSAAPSRRAVTPGVLVVGLVAEPTSLDPGQLTDINSMKLLGALYDTLLRFKPNSFDLEPSLATSWDMSPDGLVYTLKLRPGVTLVGPDFSTARSASGVTLRLTVATPLSAEPSLAR